MGRWPKFREFAALCFLALITGVIGLVLFLASRGEERPKHAQRFDMEFSGEIRDSQGDLVVSSLTWNEGHDVDFDKSSNEWVAISDEGVDDIRVATLDVRFARPAASDVELTVRIAAPKRVAVQDCSYYGMRGTVDQPQCAPLPAQYPDNGWSYLKLSGVVPVGLNHFNVRFALEGAEGLSVSDNSTYVSARFPYVRFVDDSTPQRDHVAVITIASLPDIPEFSWSQAPTLGSGIGVGWKATNEHLPPAPIIGSRDDKLAGLATWAFAAGAFFGVFASACVTLIHVLARTDKT